MPTPAERRAYLDAAEIAAEYARALEDTPATWRLQKAAETIETRIRALAAGPDERDPFTACLAVGCPEEALGAFCGRHVRALRAATMTALATAIVDNDGVAYGIAVRAAQAEIAAAEGR
jgi:hypothetical protein